MLVGYKALYDEILKLKWESLNSHTLQTNGTNLTLRTTPRTPTATCQTTSCFIRKAKNILIRKAKNIPGTDQSYPGMKKAPSAKKEYQYVDNNGRRYKKVPVHAPEPRNGETGQPWRGKMPPPGKHWQYPPSTLDEMDARGEIYWSPNGNPRRKVFLDEGGGIGVQDIWNDMRDAFNQNHWFRLFVGYGCLRTPISASGFHRKVPYTLQANGTQTGVVALTARLRSDRNATRSQAQTSRAVLFQPGLMLAGDRRAARGLVPMSVAEKMTRSVRVRSSRPLAATTPGLSHSPPPQLTVCRKALHPGQPAGVQ